MKIPVFVVTTALLASLPTICQALPISNLPTLAQVTVPTVQPGQSVPTVRPAPAAPRDAGLEFEGFSAPSTVRITDTIYRGECPGEKQGTIKARFYSTATPPGAGRRVVIRNITRGLAGDTVPFTDRDYSKGRTSESTSVEFGTQHKLTNFVVLEGQNNLEYQIKQGSNVVEQGAFTAELARGEQTRNRNATCSEEKYCRSSETTPLDKCEEVRVRYRCYCPDKPSQTFIRRDRY